VLLENTLIDVLHALNRKKSFSIDNFRDELNNNHERLHGGRESRDVVEKTTA
jgi:hypothetical protein